MTAIPQSPIDRHGIIVLLHITSAKAGAWVSEPSAGASPPMLRRDVGIEARIAERLKTPPNRQIPERMHFTVVQREPADGIKSADYGPWSDIDIAPATDVLVFARDESTQVNLERVLADQCGLLVVIPSATIPYAVEDVKRALSWAKTSGRRVLESAAVRELVNAGRHSSGPILGSYLAESTAGRPPQQPGALEAHDFLVGLVAAADAPWNFRLPILVHEVNELAMHDAAPTSFRAALVLAMFAVLGEPPSPLQEPIRQAYLNNAVFDRDGKPRIAARMAITSPAQRGRVEAALASGGLTAEQTLRWRRWLDEQ